MEMIKLEPATVNDKLPTVSVYRTVRGDISLAAAGKPPMVLRVDQVWLQLRKMHLKGVVLQFESAALLDQLMYGIHADTDAGTAAALRAKGVTA